MVKYFTWSFPSGNVIALRRKPEINHVGPFNLTKLIHGGSIEHFDTRYISMRLSINVNYIVIYLKILPLIGSIGVYMTVSAIMKHTTSCFGPIKYTCQSNNCKSFETNLLFELVDSLEFRIAIPNGQFFLRTNYRSHV